MWEWVKSLSIPAWGIGIALILISGGIAYTVAIDGVDQLKDLWSNQVKQEAVLTQEVTKVGQELNNQQQNNALIAKVIDSHINWKRTVSGKYGENVAITETFLLDPSAPYSDPQNFLERFVSIAFTRFSDLQSRSGNQLIYNACSEIIRQIAIICSAYEQDKANISKSLEKGL